MDISKFKQDGFWVKWVDGAKLKIKPLSLEEMSKLSNRHTTKYFDRKSGQWQEKLDHVALIKDVAKSVIVDWDGINDNGKPFEFTPENRDFLILNVPELSTFINEVSADYERLREIEIDNELKK